MQSNLLRAAELVHNSTLQGCVGFTPMYAMTPEEYDALFLVYAKHEGRLHTLGFEDDEHKITAMLLLHWIISDL